MEYNEITDRNGLNALFSFYGIQGKEKESRQPQQRNGQQQNRGNYQGQRAQSPQRRSEAPASANIANPSFHFYKSDAYGKNIEHYTLPKEAAALFVMEGCETFELTTTYPGLLIGSGYTHPKLKSATDDYQLGFFFDHTTGLPLISGSSIKGRIRSVFPSEEKDKNGKYKDRYHDEKIQYLKEEYDIEYSEDLVKKLFENRETVFYDAYIVKGTENGHIFGSDFITSHFSDDKEEGFFKEPNPIKFLKILPDVTFKFQFKVDEAYKSFFKDVLLDFGIGAKTNVGYGKFVA
jgi:CRISPR-associated protein Cmr6